MIRSSVFTLAALASLAVACSVPSGTNEVRRSSAAIEIIDYDPGPVVDYPIDEVPSGIIYPEWGACADGSRATRAFVRIDFLKLGIDPKLVDEDPKRFGAKQLCPDVEGHDGRWVGSLVHSTGPGFCSYAWEPGRYSEFGWLNDNSKQSLVNRFATEADARPTPLRDDIRPDCMEAPSPCIFRDGSVDCQRVGLDALNRVPSYIEQKGMSPCGACGQAVSGTEVLVVIPHWFLAIEDDPGGYEMLLEGSDGTGYIFKPPAHEQAFVVEVKSAARGATYRVSRRVPTFL